MTITQRQAQQLLRSIANDGVFFGATAEKRTDGTVKEWNGKALSDTFNEYDVANRLATVYDAKAGHPKSLALEGLREIRCYGETFRVLDDELPF